MSSEILQSESTLTSRYQTTIPREIRNALELKKHDKISYTLHPNGAVSISRMAPKEEADYVMNKFLDFLDSNILESPQIIKPLTSDMRSRMSSLVEGVEYDIDAPLSDEEE